MFSFCKAPSVNNLFLLGSGFTHSVLPQAPLNATLLEKVINHYGDKSGAAKYSAKYNSADIEILLTYLDLEIARQLSEEGGSLLLDRKKIEQELAHFFEQFRYKKDVRNSNEWLSDVAYNLFTFNDVIVTLNYDCFLEGLLDDCSVWSPNGGYGRIVNPLIDNTHVRNPKNIIIHKIHGSEHFREAPTMDGKGFRSVDRTHISFDFQPDVFPCSATNSYFGGGINSQAYLIAPSFVKTWHMQIVDIMLESLQHAFNARNFVIIGCGLRREDSHLWLLLHNFLKGRSKDGKLIICDPEADKIKKKVEDYLGMKAINLIPVNKDFMSGLGNLIELLS